MIQGTKIVPPAADRVQFPRKEVATNAEIPKGSTSEIDAPGANAKTPAHECIDHFLAATALCPSPSESHGMLCGFICGGVLDPASAWLNQLVPDAEEGDLLIEEGRRALHALAQRTLGELSSADLPVRLLLPDEDHPLAERAAAVCDWVRGFLYAWGSLGVGLRAGSEEVREILRDFTELTRMDLEGLDGLEDAEQNEEALTEVIEFIRVAMLLLQQQEPVAAGTEAKAGVNQP